MSTKKKRIEEDPNLAREAERYQRPIPSREFIMQTLEEAGRPLTQEAIAEIFDLSDETDLEALRRRLRAMERDGQLIRDRRRRYGLVSRMDLVRGRVIAHPDGFGFLVPEEGGDDLFISARRMRGVMHGDRIVARIAGVDRRGRREAAPVEILERAHQRLVGRYHHEHGVGFVTPSNPRLTQDVLVPEEMRDGAKDGQIVVVELIEQPSWRAQPIGRIAEVLGEHMAPGMEIDVAIRAYEIPHEWPEEVEAVARRIPAEVPEEAKAGRVDLRELPLVTIDGEDAKDFDDAVYVEKKGRGWRLIVAIADVASYVRPDDPLDQEACKRGNSVYFPGRVVPMLPEVLSNGLCSLNPRVDRLCMVCEMDITYGGNVKSARFYEGVMRSHARLTYTEVAAMVVEGDPELRARHAELLPHLEEAHRLYQAFRKRREKRGAIDFDTVETKIVFDEVGKIEEIVPVERNDAHKMIEEFMIAANVATAHYLLEAEIPALYRVHPAPDPDRIEELRTFLAEFGLRLKGGDRPKPKHFAELLEEVRQRPDAHLIETVMLRSLNPAVYSPDNVGHFGLSYDAYTHFTSPIRRYPDLVVHRALKHLIHRRAPGDYPYSRGDMQAIGEHCSMTERRADEATRDATDWLKCEYMMDKVGEVYDGRITGVTGFGIFVELEGIYAEGLVHITALGSDYFHFDPVHHRLTGERSGRVFRLGDPVRVRVMRVDLDERKIDFELVEEAAPRKRKGRKTPRTSAETIEGASVTEEPARPDNPPPGEGRSRSARRRRKKAEARRREQAGTPKAKQDQAGEKSVHAPPPTGKKAANRKRRSGRKKRPAGEIDS